MRLNRPIDAVEGARLALSGCCQRASQRKLARPTHDREIGLDLAVTALGLLDETMDGGLIEHLAALKDTDVLPQEPMDRR